MADFDWQTEEETSWNDPLPAVTVSEESNNRPWLPYLFVTGAIFLISGFLFFQLRNRVGGAEDARTMDILAAENLLIYAAERNDPSLLLNILPLENASWTGIQRTLIEKGLLLDRWLFGLHQDDVAPEIKNIELSPDFRTADVILEIPYLTQNNGQLETVRLQQTHYFQFRNEWRLTDLTSEYWGGLGNKVYEGGFLTALYPPRDEVIVQRLIDDLPFYFEDICNSPGRPSCGFDLDLFLHFEKEPAMWLDLEDRINENGSYISGFSPSSTGAGVIFLPAPSLIGEPVNEAGYQALLRGYASHIVSAFLATLYDEECCPGNLPFSLFREQELARRGIGFWPPPALQEEIRTDQSKNILPEKEIALLCATDQPERLTFYRFNPASRNYSAELINRNIIRIQAAPNGEGVLVQEVDVVSDDQILTRIIYWHERTARILYEETLPEPVFAAMRWQVHEEEARLVVILPDLDTRINTFVLVNLADCSSGYCPKVVREMVGGPNWSPDGSQFLIKSGNILWWRQFEGVRVNQDPLGLGTAPFWIDNETFGFVRTLENRFQEIVYGQPHDEGLSVALDSGRLRELLPEDNRPENLMIGYVGTNPVAKSSELSDWTILSFEWLHNGELGEAFVYSYNRQTDTLAVLLRSDQLHSLNLSQNGRWLAASLYDGTLTSWRIKVEPIREGEDITLLPWQADDENDPPTYDWSADGKWLLILNQGILNLYSPGQEKAILVPPPIPACVQAEWMN